MSSNPFCVKKTNKLFVALKGEDKGYLQIAPSQLITNFTNLNPLIFSVAQNWAKCLEALGAKKVYWITLSEVVEHIHIHLYPRWEETEYKGLDLFAHRNSQENNWTLALEESLKKWAAENEVKII